MIDLAKLSDVALQRMADEWNQESGNPFGDPRQEIPALVEQVIALRRRLDVLRRFADVWLKTGSDDEQLCMAYDFFDGVLHPPNLPEDGSRRGEGDGDVGPA